MTRKASKNLPLRRPKATLAKSRPVPVSKGKGSWIARFVGVMPDLGDPVTIQRELRRERR